MNFNKKVWMNWVNLMLNLSIIFSLELYWVLYIQSLFYSSFL